MSTNLKNKANACAFCFCLRIPLPFTSVMLPIRIDREGLGESRTGTRQRIGLPSCQNGHGKHNLLKTFFRVEIFQNAIFVYSFGHFPETMTSPGQI